MNVQSPLPEERLLDLFDRLRKLALDENPFQDNRITMPQLTLLDWVAAAPGCGIQDLADGLNVTAPTVSVSVRRLEEAGMLERRDDPQDGRAVQLFLTETGQALHQRARMFRQEKMRNLLQGLAPQQRIDLLTLLEQAICAAEEEMKQA